MLNSQALQLKSFSDYERDYGGLDRRSLLGYGVRQFYDNGGADAHVIRIKGDDDAVVGPADAAFQEQLNALFEADSSRGSDRSFQRHLRARTGRWSDHKAMQRQCAGASRFFDCRLRRDRHGSNGYRIRSPTGAGRVRSTRRCSFPG